MNYLNEKFLIKAKGAATPSNNRNDHTSNQDDPIIETENVKLISDLVIRWLDSGMLLSITTRPKTKYLCYWIRAGRGKLRLHPIQ